MKVESYVCMNRGWKNKRPIAPKKKTLKIPVGKKGVERRNQTNKTKQKTNPQKSEKTRKKKQQIKQTKNKQTN